MNRRESFNQGHGGNLPECCAAPRIPSPGLTSSALTSARSPTHGASSCDVCWSFSSDNQTQFTIPMAICGRPKRGRAGGGAPVSQREGRRGRRGLLPSRLRLLKGPPGSSGVLLYLICLFISRVSSTTLMLQEVESLHRPPGGDFFNTTVVNLN